MNDPYCYIVALQIYSLPLFLSVGNRFIHDISRCLWFARNKRMNHETYYLFTNNSMCLSFAGNSLSSSSLIIQLKLVLSVSLFPFHTCVLAYFFLCVFTERFVRIQYKSSFIRIIWCEGLRIQGDEEMHIQTHIDRIEKKETEKVKEKTSVSVIVFS